MGLEPVGTVMMFYGLALFALGWMGLGKADAKSAGFIALLAGLVGFIMGFYVYLSIMLAATLLLIFATTFITSGVHLMFGLDVKGLGWLCVIWGIADAIYAGYFALVAMPIFSAFCASWFIVFMLFAFWCLTGKGIYAKYAGYWCLFNSFATLLIPGFLLVTGMVFA